MHAELPIASFICAFLVLVPLPWHWRAGTIPTISIIGWLFIVNLINGINTIIWSGNVIEKVPVWCDIVTKIIIGANLALPSSLFRLCVHLERISSVRAVGETLEQKRRRLALDFLFCLGLPIIYMALHVVVQGHRFDIIEDFGCNPTTYSSIAAVFLVYLPPLICSFGACVLSALAFRNFYIRRLTFARHLKTASASLTPSRYFRLMSLAIVQMFWCIAVNLAKTVFSVRSGMRPYKSWAFVHSNWTAVGQFPAILIPHHTLLQTYVLWWSVPVSAVLFFVFFSFGQDAMSEYRACITWVQRNILRMPAPIERKRAFLPSFVKQDFKGEVSKSGAEENKTKGFRPFRILQSLTSSSTTCANSPPPYSATKDSLPSTTHDFYPPIKSYAQNKDAFSATTDTAFSFDPARGIILPSSPSSTTAPEYADYPHNKALPHPPALPSPATSGVSWPSTSASSSPTTSSGPPSSSRRSSMDLDLEAGMTHEPLPSRPPTPVGETSFVVGMPPTPSTPSSSEYPRSPSIGGVDPYYYYAYAPSSPEAPSERVPTPSGESGNGPTLSHDVPSPSPQTTLSHAPPASTPATTAPQPPSPLAPLPPHYMRSEPPMSPRPLTYPAMSPTYRDIASTFSGGRR